MYFANTVDIYLYIFLVIPKISIRFSTNKSFLLKISIQVLQRKDFFDFFNIVTLDKKIVSDKFVENLISLSRNTGYRHIYKIMNMINPKCSLINILRKNNQACNDNVQCVNK